MTGIDGFFYVYDCVFGQVIEVKTSINLRQKSLEYFIILFAPIVQPIAGRPSNTILNGKVICNKWSSSLLLDDQVILYYMAK